MGKGGSFPLSNPLEILNRRSLTSDTKLLGKQLLLIERTFPPFGYRLVPLGGNTYL